MRLNVADWLAASTIAIALMRAGIEIQRGEPAELGQPWWTFFVAALLFGLVGVWALAFDVRWVVVAICVIPFVAAMFHLSDLRAGNPTVWAITLCSGAAVVAQLVES